MKTTLTIISILISSVLIGQNRFTFSETWLYSLHHNQGFDNTHTFSFVSYNKNDNKAHTTYNIYYAKNNNWEYVGNITVQNGGGAERNLVYFKNGYRIACGKEAEKPTEISFETKKWKVD